MDKEISNLVTECRDLQAQKSKVQLQKKTAFREHRLCRQEVNKMEERKHRYIDSEGNIDYQWFILLERMESYIANMIRKDECDAFDYMIFKDILKYVKKKGNMASKIYDIVKFNNEVVQSLLKAQDGYMMDLELTRYDDKEFFEGFFKASCQLFFYTEMVAATFEVFGDEIIKISGKQVSRCTFDDLTNIYHKSLWQQIYRDGEMSFVTKALSEVLSYWLKQQPLQSICINIRDFIRKYCDGNYLKFSCLMATSIMNCISELDEITLKPHYILDEILGCMALLFVDRKDLYPHKSSDSRLVLLINGFIHRINNALNMPSDVIDLCILFYGSASLALKLLESIDNNKNNVFEEIIAHTLTAFAVLDGLPLEPADKLGEFDKKRIEDQKQMVLTKASELKSNDETHILIEKFFNFGSTVQ